MIWSYDINLRVSLGDSFLHNFTKRKLTPLLVSILLISVANRFLGTTSNVNLGVFVQRGRGRGLENPIDRSVDKVFGPTSFLTFGRGRWKGPVRSLSRVGVGPGVEESGERKVAPGSPVRAGDPTQSDSRTVRRGSGLLTRLPVGEGTVLGCLEG